MLGVSVALDKMDALKILPQAFFDAIGRVKARDAGYGRLLHLHPDGIPYYFEGAIMPVHLYAKPIIMKAVRRLGGKQFVLASTDAGRAKWGTILSQRFGS